MTQKNAEEVTMFIYVRKVSDELDDPEDEGVEGLYAVIFEFETDAIPKAKLASVALDAFHSQQPIGFLEDFEIHAVDDTGKFVDEDEDHENGSDAGLAYVEKAQNPNIMESIRRVLLPPNPEGRNDDRSLLASARIDKDVSPANIESGLEDKRNAIMTYDELADAIRNAEDLRELKRLVGPSAEEQQICRDRLARLDALAPLCKFEKFDGQCTAEEREARERYMKIQREQSLFENAYL